jgi:hypothetical protein
MGNRQERREMSMAKIVSAYFSRKKGERRYKKIYSQKISKEWDFATLKRMDKGEGKWLLRTKEVVSFESSQPKKGIYRSVRNYDNGDSILHRIEKKGGR